MSPSIALVVLIVGIVGCYLIRGLVNAWPVLTQMRRQLSRLTDERMATFDAGQIAWNAMQDCEVGGDGWKVLRGVHRHLAARHSEIALEIRRKAL